MTAPGAIPLPPAAMDRLMPLHLVLDAAGRIVSLGPTLAKLAGPEARGADFFDAFTVRRPSGVQQMADLAARPGERLHLICHAAPGIGLRGLALPDAAGGMVLNLSFGMSLVEAVRQHQLCDADFAATDLAVEMLYLVEAKDAVLAELQRLNQRLQGAKSRAEEQALTDTLTGLRNRRGLDRRLRQALAGDLPFALLHLDLDGFKAVNDTLGHGAGDQVLRQVAQVLLAETRSGDFVARVGGDEFVLLLPGLTDPARLLPVAERIVARLAEPLACGAAQCRIGASIGLTVSSHYPRPDPRQMQEDADRALYAAKRAGRGRVVAAGRGAAR